MSFCFGFRAFGRKGMHEYFTCYARNECGSLSLPNSSCHIENRQSDNEREVLTKPDKSEGGFLLILTCDGESTFVFQSDLVGSLITWSRKYS